MSRVKMNRIEQNSGGKNAKLDEEMDDKKVTEETLLIAARQSDRRQ